ncbi:MAG: long-chain-fatty-acid--CoA ligase [Burkholderiaceae bacterium]|nr:long-chain-fatty-acid--CoA ligase [Burkholderiaceae bacterium]
MHGLMQDRPLLISSLLTHAQRFHGEREIVSQLADGRQHRSCWREIGERAQRLANAMAGLGVADATRVGTLAWNTHRHLELYFGVPGMGAVLHTVNPRLHLDQIAYIIDHAGDEVLCFDVGFADLVAALVPRCPKVRHWVALCDAAGKPQIAGLAADQVLAYESLLDQAAPQYDWPALDERQASSLCYTSGTTGNPKGVLYSHRSTVLHCFAACAADGLGLAARDSVLLVVPLFHVNAWGVPYAGAMAGAKLVLPGANLGGEAIYRLLAEERCNFTLGVPTVWLGLFDHIERHRAQLDLSQIRLERVVIGGSAAPRALIEKFDAMFGAFAIHAWGMSETSPLGTIGRLLAKHEGLQGAARHDVQCKAGRAIFGVEIEIFDDEGRPLPHDGLAFGELKARGPWVAAGYFGLDQPAVDAQGWFATGDVATIDGDGYIQITDRAKDVIKSGGEWISSIELENVAVGHPAVQEAAVIGVAHRRWQERPLLLVQLKPGAQAGRQELLDWFDGKVASWWKPDDVQLVDSLPHTATGKLQKRALREQFQGHRLPTDPG